MKVPLCITTVTLASATCAIAAFAPPAPRRRVWGRVAVPVRPRGATLLCASEADKGDDWAVIKADSDEEEEWDLSLGGVGLAMDSAIKISGGVRKGAADATDMALYGKLTEFDDADAKAAMDKAGVALICSGLGKELYKDPGMTTTREIVYGPSDAVRDALSSVPTSVSGASSVVLNFLGGDDLISDEVFDACELMVQGLDLSGKTNVAFNSLCHKSIPSGTASVTVVATGDSKEGDSAGLSGVSKSVSEGDVYFYQGKWYTVVEEDLSKD